MLFYCTFLERENSAADELLVLHVLRLLRTTLDHWHSGQPHRPRCGNRRAHRGLTFEIHTTFVTWCSVWGLQYSKARYKRMPRAKMTNEPDSLCIIRIPTL